MCGFFQTALMCLPGHGRPSAARRTGTERQLPLGGPSATRPRGLGGSEIANLFQTDNDALHEQTVIGVNVCFREKRGLHRPKARADGAPFT